MVGIQDELKGQIPCALFVLKKNQNDDENSAEKVKSELVQMVRKEVGAVAAFKMAVAVKDIPRTRSGKIFGRQFVISHYSNIYGCAPYNFK